MDMLNMLKLKFQNFKYTSIFNRYISTPIGMYIVWILLHYVSAHLYKMHCAPDGLWGFLISPLMASTPYCTGLIWILQNSVIQFMAVWTIVGSWVSIKLRNTPSIIQSDNKKEHEEPEEEEEEEEENEEEKEDKKKK